MRRTLTISGTVLLTLCLAATRPADAAGPDDGIAPLLGPASYSRAPAQATAGAVVLGGIAAAGWSGVCGGANASFIQKAQGPGTSSYTVPRAGVITSASHFATPQATGSLRLEFLTPGTGANQWDVEAFTPLLPMTPNAVNTWPLQIPVPAGTTIGLFMPSSNVACNYAGVTGDQVSAGGAADPSTTSSFMLGTTFTSIRLNLSAVWEPDVDSDGFGDVSQDACPQSATTQSACPAPDVTITKAPKKTSSKRKAKIKFTSSVAGSTFTCKVDKGRAKACTSPFKKKYRYGKHKVLITATSPMGIADPKPAKVKFKITKPS